MICHDAYVTQDGYDSGQRFICEEHGVSEPVMENGKQSYDVTLDKMIELLYEHAKAVKAEEDAHPLLPLDEMKGFSIFGPGQGETVEIRTLGSAVSEYIPATPEPDPLFALLEQVKPGDRVIFGDHVYVAGERMSAGTTVMMGDIGEIVRYRRGDE